MKHILLPALLLAALITAAAPFATHAQSAVPQADVRALKPGEFLWYPQIAPEGPVVLVVSLDEQRAYVYRNGIAIGVSTISSGKAGKDTPTGVFTILQKNKDHRSNLYNNAPMPYMQRLTWDGIALHGGHLPGYPASHGCVRLPQAFAEKLFGITRFGDSVVVANAKASPASLVHPAVLAPVTSGGQAAHPDLSTYEVYWNEAASPEGPVSILVSLYDQRVSVLRNGVLIGAAPLQMVRDFALNGTVLLVMTTEMEDIPSLLDPRQKEHRWVAHRVLGEEGAPMPPLRSLGDSFWIPQDFARRLYGVLKPGTTVLLSDLPGVRATPDDQPSVPVLESDEASPTPVSR
ncbi:L,D-transpeptidase [Pseudoxanthomonas sp. LH2527]|uniref:L,D-transpeptidase n=1 Tax=Pseudoxanthomonas sp. LH2527 TaxID=2923249 RepID=UPI001F1489CA|nr:L,D-transpeptidase [Pseudoxanthomonas sp. LH2527]MCH6484432.1 L,D-transpeptidase [Pseudoxanthomonas sp. LH2527]